MGGRSTYRRWAVPGKPGKGEGEPGRMKPKVKPSPGHPDGEVCRGSPLELGLGEAGPKARRVASGGGPRGLGGRGRQSASATRGAATGHSVRPAEGRHGVRAGARGTGPGGCCVGSPSGALGGGNKGRGRRGWLRKVGERGSRRAAQHIGAERGLGGISTAGRGLSLGRAAARAEGTMGRGLGNLCEEGGSGHRTGRGCVRSPRLARGRGGRRPGPEGNQRGPLPLGGPFGGPGLGLPRGRRRLSGKRRGTERAKVIFPKPVSTLLSGRRTSATEPARFIRSPPALPGPARPAGPASSAAQLPGPPRPIAAAAAAAAEGPERGCPPLRLRASARAQGPSPPTGPVTAHRARHRPPGPSPPTGPVTAHRARHRPPAPAGAQPSPPGSFSVPSQTPPKTLSIQAPPP
ncbi:uncharacterized protein LOC116421838 [Sarcophilus harrisii]|uniref:uncharacterized protein LOC116421838 n=1 Tax=Sarcophilus harrisii TaxID=9305 RepID=UPI001301DEE9|nr:uncharacterized protein LOC116421838 [Sarcophilus harrisii]